jgi:nucleoid-associated protein YgaU
MGKEVKIGLAVIGVLLCVFGGVLFFRLRREKPAAPKELAAAVKKDAKAKQVKKHDRDREKPEDDKPAEDRYGRLTGESARSTIADGLSPTEQSATNQTEPPSLERSPYRNRSADDRYDRYREAATEAADDRNNDAADEAGQPTGDLAASHDRFAQPVGGMTFSDDDNSDQTDAPADDDVAEAPELSIERADRFGGQRMVENDLEEPAETDETDNQSVQLAPVAEEESDQRPAANDRFARLRHDRERFERRTAPDAEELVDESAETRVSEPIDEAPRPFQHRPESDSYVVEPNDNFWRISQKVYGTGAYFKALEEHNRRQYGNRALVNVGDVVSVPSLAVLRENYPDLCPKPRNVPADRRETSLASSSVRGGRGGRTYTVAEGDTLFDIARQELGKASRWAEIYRLNRDQLGEDFNYLSPGMQLLLPERGDSADPIASRPARDRYRR